jgi:hypothetical protein
VPPTPLARAVIGYAIAAGDDRAATGCGKAHEGRRSTTVVVKQQAARLVPRETPEQTGYFPVATW